MLYIQYFRIKSPDDFGRMVSAYPITYPTIRILTEFMYNHKQEMVIVESIFTTDLNSEYLYNNTLSTLPVPTK
jgi:prolipoprotein diacylglyceryltransferase